MPGSQSTVDQTAPMVLVDGLTDFLKKPQPDERVQLLLVTVGVDRRVFRHIDFALRRLAFVRAWDS